jgi:DUF2075 family protein
MLAYIATKGQFLQDAPEIEELVRAKVEEHHGIRISRESSEYQSWRNSLGNAMYHVMNSADIPNDAGVAIEYRLHGRGQRIDFIVSGHGESGTAQLLLIELKQWQDVEFSTLDDHVRTYLHGGLVNVRHPSYQVWSYGRLLHDFYEYVVSDPVVISPSAYLHNCHIATVVKAGRYSDLLAKAPVFLANERRALQDLITSTVRRGDASSVIRRVESSPVQVSKQLADALESMLRGNEEFVLIDDQKTAYESIREAIRTVPDQGKAVVLVKGGPGTGKSVIAINALVHLLAQNVNVRYVTKNAAPRAVYQAKLNGKRLDVATNNLFVSSDAFHTVSTDAFDVLLVDEAHRLVEKSGFYRNLGVNQISEIINAARVNVFFSDESQLVTWRDIGTLENIRAASRDAGIPLKEFELTTQFRCAGSSEYLHWLDHTLGLGGGEKASLRNTEFDLRQFDDPSELRDFIVEKNLHNNKSRLLAGYCWDWVSKKDSSLFDIEFPASNFSMKWNLTEDGSAWMISPTSINEIGCIHTCQGLEGDFIGVIIGDDLEVVDGMLRGNPFKRSKGDQSLRGFTAAFKTDPESALARADVLIRNTYRTLWTRGMLGTAIYCTNDEVRQFFEARMTALGVA